MKNTASTQEAKKRECDSAIPSTTLQEGDYMPSSGYLLSQKSVFQAHFHKDENYIFGKWTWRSRKLYENFSPHSLLCSTLRLSSLNPDVSLTAPKQKLILSQINVGINLHKSNIFSDPPRGKEKCKKATPCPKGVFSKKQLDFLSQTRRSFLDEKRNVFKESPVA